MFDKINISQAKYIKEKFYLDLKFQRFAGINEEKRKEITEFAHKKSIIFKKNSLNKYDFYFHILRFLNHKTNYNKIFDMNSDESIIFLIEAVDPELKFLEIYEWESNLKNIKIFLINTFGFYDENLFIFEKEYAKKFNKDIVSFTKKRI